MRTWIAAFLLFAATAAAADTACVRPDAAPAVPDGSKADEETMHTAHDMIQAYVNHLEAYQACLQKLAAAPPAGTTPEQRVTWLAQGEAAVDAANVIASSFSASLKIFKARGATSAK